MVSLYRGKFLCGYGDLELGGGFEVEDMKPEELNKGKWVAVAETWLNCI
jgi:hypothetical protein